MGYVSSVRCRLLLLLGLVFAQSAQPASATEAADLVGVWTGDSGATYYIEEDEGRLVLTVWLLSREVLYRGDLAGERAALTHELKHPGEVEAVEGEVPARVRRALVYQNYIQKKDLLVLGPERLRLTHRLDEVRWDEEYGGLLRIRPARLYVEELKLVEDVHVVENLRFTDIDPPFATLPNVPIGASFRLEVTFFGAPPENSVKIDLVTPYDSTIKIEAIRQTIEDAPPAVAPAAATAVNAPPRGPVRGLSRVYRSFPIRLEDY
jgi:hypothetical protein